MLIIIINGQTKKWNSYVLSPKAVQRLCLRDFFVQAEKSLTCCRTPHPVSQSTGPQPSHYAAVTAHWSTLIPHGLLGSMFPSAQVTDIHLCHQFHDHKSLSRRSSITNSQQNIQKQSTRGTYQWQWHSDSGQRSHVQVKLIDACYGQELSKEKPGKWTINLTCPEES